MNLIANVSELVWTQYPDMVLELHATIDGEAHTVLVGRALQFHLRKPRLSGLIARMAEATLPETVEVEQRVSPKGKTYYALTAPCAKAWAREAYITHFTTKNLRTMIRRGTFKDEADARAGYAESWEYECGRKTDEEHAEWVRDCQLEREYPAI